MRVLRLTSSADTYVEVPEEARSWRLGAALVEQATGEPVETIIRAIWPTPELPGLVESWIQRYRPDVVLFWVNTYWFTFIELPAAPRSKRRVVRAAGRLAKRSGLKSELVYRAGKLRRRLLLWRGVGREPFEPDDVIAVVAACIHAILHHEDVGLVVRGPMHPNVTMLTPELLTRGERRRRRVHRAVRSICAELHVRYFAVDDGLAYIARGLLARDGLHQNAVAHAQMAAEEAGAYIEAVNLRGERIAGART